MWVVVVGGYPRASPFVGPIRTRARMQERCVMRDTELKNEHKNSLGALLFTFEPFRWEAVSGVS